MAAKPRYIPPYHDILGTVDQARLENSLQPIIPDFRLYEELSVLKRIGDVRDLLGDKKSHELQLVRELLRQDRAKELDGIPEPWWWLFFARMLWNMEIDIDPWFELKWWIWEELRGKMQCANQWGNQNSGKTFFSGRFPIVQLTVWDRDAIGFISGPYKLHSQDKTWREVKKAVKHIKVDLKGLFGIELKDNRDEITMTSAEGTGFIKFVAAQEASSVQGGKSDRHREDGRRGISFFSVDEFIENPNMDLAESFGNYRSNFNSFTLLSCNPKSEKVKAPALLAFADPIEKKRSALRKKADFRWRTRKGIVVRFSWDNCPNNILNRTRWTYLMDKKRMETQLLEEDHIRSAQLDAWGWGSEGANTLTDANRQIAAGVFAEYLHESPRKMRLFALDPAFGGSDPAVYAILDVGTIMQDRSMDRFIGVEQGYLHGIETDFIADLDFIRKARAIVAHRHKNGDRNTEYLEALTVGSLVDPMAQGAVLAAHLCIEKNVPFDCFTFDASQRADCADWIFKVFGRQNIVWFYEGSRRLIQEEGEEWLRWPFRTRDEGAYKGVRYERWSDWCGRVITMIWAFACELINNGYLVQGDKVQRGLDELGIREVASTSSGKVDVWSKADIKRGSFQGKKIPQMQSPAWAETLAMALYFGARYKNAIDLGQMPELTLHEGDTSTEVEDWLENMSTLTN